MRFCAPLRASAVPALQWVEVTSRFQIPSFHIVGLASQEIHEARERVRSAIEASQWEFPRRKVVINLSPADIRKQGTALDLAMALSIRALSSRPEESGALEATAASGELGLHGQIRPSGRVLHALSSCADNQVQRLLLSQADATEARLLQSRFPALREIQVHGCNTLSEAWDATCSSLRLPVESRAPDHLVSEDSPRPPSRVHLLTPGPEIRRVLEIAVTGRHHCLILGPRGCGKSQALQWATGLLPAPSLEQLLRAELLFEARGETRTHPALLAFAGAEIRPSALLGHASTSETRPGLLALAHGGVLLADELPEWPRDARECLRGPLEDRVVRLHRARRSVQFPADFRLLASGNLCECGGVPPESPRLAKASPASGRLEFAPESTLCSCTLASRRSYRARLSGPILDRLDLVLAAHFPLMERGKGPVESQERVLSAHALLQSRYGALPNSLSASELEALLTRLRVWSIWDQERSWKSLRSRHRVASVGLTIAALESSEPKAQHFSEALLYRPDRLS